MGDKEVKLVSANFDTVASSLTEDKSNLNSTMDTLSATNDALKSDWLGDGGNSFVTTAKSIEEEFKARISELEGEINDLQVAKTTMVGLDTQLGSKISNSIDGITVNVSGTTEGSANNNSKTMSI